MNSENAKVSGDTTTHTAVILSEAPLCFALCIGPGARSRRIPKVPGFVILRQAFSRELPEAFLSWKDRRDPSTRPHPGTPGLGLAQDDSQVRACQCFSVLLRLVITVWAVPACLPLSPLGP